MVVIFRDQFLDIFFHFLLCSFVADFDCFEGYPRVDNVGVYQFLHEHCGNISRTLTFNITLCACETRMIFGHQIMDSSRFKTYSQQHKLTF